MDMETFKALMTIMTKHEEKLSQDMQFILQCIKVFDNLSIIGEICLRDNWVEEEFIDLLSKVKELNNSITEWLLRHNYDKTGKKIKD